MKTARFVLVLLAAALLVSVQAAYAAEATLVILAPSDVANLDPAFCMDNVEWRQTYVAYDRLVQYDGKSTTVKPMVADSWNVSPDGKVYTFKLRRDVKFWDGTPLDAKAVKFSFDRVKKMGKGPSEAFGALSEVKVIDDYTVQMVLSNAFAPFLSCLATRRTTCYRCAPA
ncbi:MAG: ABC transporter substrate-binding protein [Bacillota bacterium]